MTIQLLPGGRHLSLTDLYRYYLVLFFLYVSSSMMRYLSYYTYRCRFPTGGLREKGKEGRGKGRGPLYVYIPEKLSNKSKFESSNEEKKKMRQSCLKCRS
jgi:hypothetical protein